MGGLRRSASPRRPRRCHAKLVLLLAALACSDSSPTEPLTFGEIVTFEDHREVSVSVAVADGTLRGTLYLPPSGEALPAVALTLGSSWRSRASWDDVAPVVTGLGVGVLTTDKRGYGASGGARVADGDASEATLSLLAEDLVATAAVLRDAPLVSPEMVGVVGSSYGGWVVPIAAGAAPRTIDFTIVIAGGAVSPSQDALYDELTGYDVCERTATPLADIIQALRDSPIEGFDPRPSLATMTQPGLWLYGENDFSHSADYSVEILNEVNSDGSRDWTTVIVPGANHEMLIAGICDTEGPPADALSPMSAWLTDQLGAW